MSVTAANNCRLATAQGVAGSPRTSGFDQPARADKPDLLAVHERRESGADRGDNSRAKVFILLEHPADDTELTDIGIQRLLRERALRIDRLDGHVGPAAALEDSTYVLAVGETELARFVGTAHGLVR